MALQFASPRSPAGYLANLKPILDSATATRTSWLRFLSELANSADLAAVSDEAIQAAVRHRERFNESRRALNQMTAPDMYRDMERALDGWLEALAGSCNQLASAQPPIAEAQVNTARRRLRDAAQQADKFNAERASIITVGGPPPGEESPPGERLGNNKRLIILTLLGLVLLIVVLYFAFGALGTSSVGATTTPTGGPAGRERRVFQRSEVLDRLKQEIAARKVAFLDPDVKLVPPDRIIVTGKIQGPVSLIPVEAELQVGVTDSGKPRITPTRINATGLQVPGEALDALNKRTDEANKVLPDQVAPNQFVRRIFVENDTIVVELEAAGAPASGTPGAAGTPSPPAGVPPPAGAPASKPGG